MDERLASSSNNARVRRELRAQERTAESLERIADVLQMWFWRSYPDCAPPENRVLTADENDEAMKTLQAMFCGPDLGTPRKVVRNGVGMVIAREPEKKEE